MATITSLKGTKQERRLKPADALIYHIIFRQAGTLAKALLEGVMNSVDAKATEIRITLEAEKFIIEDDGKGFSDEHEIEHFFETFGTAHELDEHGISKDAKFGTFRIGRGQMFAYAATVWRSGQFEMAVDVKNRGLDWSLTSDLPEFSGCRIEGPLYAPLSLPDLRETERTIAMFVKWVNLPVYFNGTLVSKDPEKHPDWDENTREYYLQTTGVAQTSGVEVYQQGVYVMTVPHHQHGISGVVVTKQGLVLNTARNDVLSTCPVWKRIRASLRKLGDNEITAKAAKVHYLNEGDRLAVFEQLREGRKHPGECGSLPLFEDTTGRLWSANQIGRMTSKSSGWNLLADGLFGILFGKADSQKCDRILQLKAAMALSESNLAMMDASTPEEAFRLINKMSTTNLQWRARICNQAEVLEGLDGEHRPITEAKWTAREKLILSALSVVAYDVSYAVREHLGSKQYDPVRSIGLGESDTADAWTDGKRFITFNRKRLGKDSHTESFFYGLVALLIHEYCHTTNSACDHGHKPEFYRAFHDVILRRGHTIARKAFHTYVNGMAKVKGKLPQVIDRDIQRQADAAFADSLLEQLDRDKKTAVK
jgi:hypothetical protein